MAITIAEMKRRSAAGGEWFSKGTMKFFGTRIETKPDRHNMFITSEGNEAWYAPTKYTVRMFVPKTGNVVTVGDFHKHTFDDAKAVRRLLGKALDKATDRERYILERLVRVEASGYVAGRLWFTFATTWEDRQGGSSSAFQVLVNVDENTAEIC